MVSGCKKLKIHSKQLKCRGFAKQNRKKLSDSRLNLNHPNICVKRFWKFLNGICVTLNITWLCIPFANYSFSFQWDLFFGAVLCSSGGEEGGLLGSLNHPRIWHVPHYFPPSKNTTLSISISFWWFWSKCPHHENHSEKPCMPLFLSCMFHEVKAKPNI